MTYLNLSNANFSGQIASEISHLSNLVFLDLSRGLRFQPNYLQLLQRNFTQLLQSVFLDQSQGLRFQQNDLQLLQQNLTQISVLCLSGVDISSEIPMNLSSTLTHLDLSLTGVYGKLSKEFIGQLPKVLTLKLRDNPYLMTGNLLNFNCSTSSPLQVLDLAFTNLPRRLPNPIGCMKCLKVLHLQDCQLSGPLPESFGNLSNLIELNLASNNFIGKFPEAISNLMQLRTLMLFENQFEDQIPDSFTNLKKLTFVSLSDNNIFGCFPPSISNLTELKVLDIADNSMTGPLPSNLSHLQKLSVLILSNNSLKGTLPSWLFRHPSLRVLILSYNQFTGQMDDVKGNSSVLEWIELNNNQLHGQIPQSISTLPNLIALDLSSNNFSGIVEANMFSSLRKLSGLGLSDNRFLWSMENNVNISFPDLWELRLSSCGITEFPDFLKTTNDLGFLELSHNNINQIPSWFSSMPWNSLVYLNLSHNSLYTLVPLPWKSIQFLDFRFNQIQGPLPPSICNLEALQILDLSNNKFNGAIPRCFGNLSTELSVLDLKNNRLQGSISHISLSPKCSLEHLGLSGNLLEGSLPESLASCEQLEVLDVGNNNISDTFPLWLENLKEIKVLILKSNWFVGPIGNFKTDNPLMKLRIFDLSNNKFTGVLPTRLFKNLRGMMHQDQNELQAMYIGTYSENANYQDSMVLAWKGQSIEFTRILATLTTVDLSGNEFSGEIPKVIGNLFTLKVLNLSNNRLSGQIPSTFGKLISLESLDLSCNQIEREIPSQLANLTFLEVLNLSQNQLVGRIPDGPQFKTFSNNSYIGNLGLCGFPLTENCEETEVPLPSPQLTNQQEEDSGFFSGFTWKSVIVGYGFGLVVGLSFGSLMFLTGKPERIVRFIEEEAYHCGLLLFGKKKVHNRFKRPKRRGHRLQRRTH